MNLPEFKAWFEGFTEAMDGPPGAKAWKRIQERVGAIVPEPTPWPVIVREYPSYWRGPYWAHNGMPATYNTAGLGAEMQLSMAAQQAQYQAAAEDPAAVFMAIGRQEAEELKQ